MASWLPLLRRILFYATMAGMLAFASIIVALRWWVLPEIGHYRADIEAQISRAAGQKVAIGDIQASWRGLRPHLKLGQVVIHDRAGLPALAFDGVEATLSWRTLYALELRLHHLEIFRPRLEIKREKNGLIYVSGIAVNDPATPHGFGDWLLRQEAIHIHHAAIEWQDNLRGAPPLALADVGLRIEGGSRRHRFGLQASAPKELASTLDVRGDLRGVSFERWQEWSGSLYANLGDTDISAWRAWVDLPYRINQGHGSVQLWVDLKAGHPSAVTGLVKLQSVKARLGKHLPELDLARLTGRLAWRELPRGFEMEAKQIEVDAGAGRQFSTQAMLARYQAAEGKTLEQGEFHAGAFDIAPLLALSEYLPLSDAQRDILKGWSPQGRYKSLDLKWEGARESPQKYSIKSEFQNVGIKPVGKAPGFSNMSGSMQADEQGGKLKLEGKQATLDMPLVFRHLLNFDDLAATAKWRIKNQRVTFDLEKANFSNAHLSGSIEAIYESSPDSAGHLDLTGALTRGDGTAAYQYIPRVVGDNTYLWLKEAVLKGGSDDVRIKVKGPLDRFPFVDDREGIFQITAKVKDVTLRYAPSWPQIEQIQAALDFHGKRMEITASQGMILGTSLPRVKVLIPDLLVHDEIIEIDGEAQGGTANFLRFIEESPVAQSIDHFTQPMKAEGNGKLALSLRMPLRRLPVTRVVGSYQFTANKIWLSAQGPVLDQASGKIDFTDSSLTIPRITGQALGGPITISANPAPGGVVRVTAGGRFTAGGLQQAYPGALSQRLKGASDWSASIALRKKAANFTLVSNLVGLSSDLPYPLAKAAQESMPLKFERRLLDANHDALDLSLGRALSVHLLRDTEGEAAMVEKGTVMLGGAAAPTPTNDGVWVDGELDKLDADAWRSLIPAKENGASALPLSGVHLKVKTLDFLGRRFSNLNLNAWTQRDTWQATLDSDEMQGGEIVWREREGGKLEARFKQLTFPEAAPARGVPVAGGRDIELPALDIVIENAQLKQVKLGKLELLARKQGADWRIERMRMVNPEATFNADGVWQSWLAQPLTKLNLELETKDVGKLLARVGHPDRIKAGTAKLSGSLSWRGSPQDFNLASLSGDMKLDAHRGQFLKVDPGVGKLLGLLSLQSLPRRLTLDFRDVFSEGFAFDNIVGMMSVNQGVVATNDFVMQGPAAVGTMIGTTDLAKETQILRVKVVPGVSDSVSLVAFLGGPAVGLGAFILQKLLKDPLGQIVAYDYAVTGTWDNPVVAKVKANATEFAQ
ncbi:MAG: TIGR02099 family protein [Betaproteobacteria bacterium RBG_19FT_COMBO_58_11]|nr:MAG: TIGR02099 family protein [Betaproteobacteria bacterium RBG_19FT_COMBO_58_11]